MRKPIIAGNWKMNKTPAEARQLVTELIPLVKDAACDVVVCTPAVCFAAVAPVIAGTNIKLGAQNVHFEAKGAFTVAIATEDLMVQADYVGLVSGSKGNKLEKAGLRTVKSEHVDAPVLQDFPVTLECRVMSVTRIGQHMHIVGEIVNVLAEESVLNEKGQIDAARLKAIAYDPADNQYLAASRPVGKAFSAGIPLIK